MPDLGDLGPLLGSPLIMAMEPGSHTSVAQGPTSGDPPPTHQAEICLGHVPEHLEIMNVNAC